MRFGSCHGNYIFFLLKRRINSYAHSLQFIKLVIYSGFKDSVPIHSFLKFKLEYTHFYSFESVKQNKELFVSYLFRFFMAGYSPWGHKESDTTERARTLLVSCRG